VHAQVLVEVLCWESSIIVQPVKGRYCCALEAQVFSH